MHQTLKLPNLSQKVIKRLGSFSKRKKRDQKFLNQGKQIREQQEKIKTAVSKMKKFAQSIDLCPVKQICLKKEMVSSSIVIYDL